MRILKQTFSRLIVFCLPAIGFAQPASITREPLQDVNGSLVCQGETRTWLIHFPSGYNGNTTAIYPVVLAFHGGGGSGLSFSRQTRLSEKADEAGFIVVYPDGLETRSGKRTWNAGACCGINEDRFNSTGDVAFISQLVDSLGRNYRVDLKRVYATGHSNGAMFCYRLANELSEKIAAIAPTSGAFQMAEPYRPARNVPVLHIQSVADSNAKCNGGFSKNAAFTGLNNHPVDSCLSVVAGVAGCAGGKKEVADYPLYSVYSWTSGCSSRQFEVTLYLTKDGGHSWPGASPRLRLLADPPSRAFRNDDVIWDFFRKYSL